MHLLILVLMLLMWCIFFWYDAKMQSVIRKIKERYPLWDKLFSLQSEIISELDHYGNLEPGWDGYRAPGFSQEFLQFMKNITKEIFTTCVNAPSCPFLIKLDAGSAPCSDGSISLTLQLRERSLELNFDPYQQDTVQIVAEESEAIVSDKLVPVCDIKTALAAWLSTAQTES